MPKQLPKKLFRYRPINKIEKINLEKIQLYFAAPRRFNDPFDCTIIQDTAYYSDEQLIKIYNRWVEVKKPNGYIQVDKIGDIPNQTKNLILSIIKREFRPIEEEYLNNRGCICFTETNDNILMWSHYSNNHRGMCLEYDTSMDLFSKARKVDYSDRYPAWFPLNMMLEPNNFGNSKDFWVPLTTKSNVWDYEEEWRIFHMENGVEYSIPPQFLTAIYFGMNTSKIDIKEIEVIAKEKYPHISFFQAFKSDSEYKIVFKHLGAPGEIDTPP